MKTKNIALLFVTLFALALISSCSMISTDCVKGKGTITTSELSIGNFTGIDLAIANDVTISQGAVQKVEVTGHPNIIDKIKTNVSDNVWRIDFKSGCYKDYKLSVNITMPVLNYVGLSGTGDVTVNDFTEQSKLALDLSGTGDIILNNFEGIDNLSILLSGTGDIKANKNISTLKTLNCGISGTGDYIGFNISCENSTVNSSGTGDCQLTVSKTLTAKISGTGNIYYKDQPTINKNISGTGSIINKN